MEVKLHPNLALKLAETYVNGNMFGESYKRIIRESQNHFILWMAENSLNDLSSVTKKDINKYQNELCNLKSKKTGQPLTNGTIIQRYRGVKILFKTLYKVDAIKENPTHGNSFKLKTGKGWKRRALTKKEISTFLEELIPDTEKGLRDRSMFELIYSSGLRVSEAAYLKIGDIDFNTRQMIVRGKFKRDRMVPISDVARDFLIPYLKERINSKEEIVFIDASTRLTNKGLKPQSISTIFRKLLKKFDMERKELSAHSIRHSTATHLLENGMSIRAVQELLGHKSIETTAKYTHVKDEGLFKIYMKYHPREHDLFEIVDEEYLERLGELLTSSSRP